jgi:transcription initiation factor TFIID subunit 13
VETLEAIVIEFITSTCHEAAKCAIAGRRNKIKVDDFKFAVRRDPLKLGRVQELMASQKRINEARKMQDVLEERGQMGVLAKEAGIKQDKGDDGEKEPRGRGRPKGKG